MDLTTEIFHQNSFVKPIFDRNLVSKTGFSSIFLAIFWFLTVKNPDLKKIQHRCGRPVQVEASHRVFRFVSILVRNFMTHPVPTSITQAGTLLAILTLFWTFWASETLLTPVNTPCNSWVQLSVFSAEVRTILCR